MDTSVSSWHQNLKIGDTVDLKQAYEETWEVATILEIGENGDKEFKLSVQLEIEGDYYTECIIQINIGEKCDDLIAPLHTHTLKFDRLQPLLNCSPNPIPQCICDNNTEYIFLINNNNEIMKYNQSKWMDRNASIDSTFHALHALDTQNNIIFLMNNNFNKLLQYNVSSNSCATKTDIVGLESVSQKNAHILYIPAPFDEFHIIDHQHHLIMNRNGDQIIKLCDHTLQTIKMVIYIPSMHRIFAADNSNIYFYDLHYRHDRSRWLICSQIPSLICDSHEPFFAVGFDHILFVFDRNWEFYFGSKTGGEICCFDFYSKKWYTSHKRFPLPLRDLSLKIQQRHSVTTPNNNVHIFGSNFHFKLSLFDVLPDEIKNLYKYRHKALVIRYCTNMQKKYSLKGMSLDLKKVILSFVTWFI